MTGNSDSSFIQGIRNFSVHCSQSQSVIIFRREWWKFSHSKSRIYLAVLVPMIAGLILPFLGFSSLYELAQYLCVVIAIWLGASGAIISLVEEFEIIKRECQIGLVPIKYITGKTGFHVSLVAIQVFLLIFMSSVLPIIIQEATIHSIVSGSSTNIELASHIFFFFSVLISSIVGVGIGLLLSSLAIFAEKGTGSRSATAALPLFMILMIILTVSEGSEPSSNLPISSNEETIKEKIVSLRANLSYLTPMGWSHRAAKLHEEISSEKNDNKKGLYKWIQTNSIVLGMFLVYWILCMFIMNYHLSRRKSVAP